MKNGILWKKALVWLITALTAGICSGLTAAGVVLYLRGSAAVQAHTAETIFTREQVSQALRPFLIPALVLAALLIAAAAAHAGAPDGASSASRSLTAAARDAKSVSAYRGMSAGWLWLCLLAAAALIGAGVLNGGLRDVLVKAVNICTECIGLG